MACDLPMRTREAPPNTPSILEAAMRSLLQQARQREHNSDITSLNFSAKVAMPGPMGIVGQFWEPFEDVM